MVNKILTKLAVPAVLVIHLAAPAQAEGLYVAGSLGAPDYKSAVHGVGGRGRGASGKLAGGVDVLPGLAFEAGLFDLGHVDDGRGRVNLHGGYVDGVGRYELAPRWSLLGRAGLAQGRFTGSTGADSSPAFKLGAGVQYDVATTAALRLEYEHYRFSSAFDAKVGVGTLTVGLKAGF